MRKAKWLRFALIGVFIPLIVANVTTPCNDVSRINVQGVYHYNIYNTPGCNKDWRGISPIAYPNEDYSFCWVSTDGSFYRTSAVSTSNAPAPGAPPNTDIPIATLAGAPLLFTGVANRKGDDDDTKKIAGGFNVPNSPNAGQHPLYASFPATQNILTGNARSKIQNDYGSDLIGKTDEILLILTIDNPETTDSIPSPSGYKLKLTHSNTSVIYLHKFGNAQGDYPNDDDEYFEFAARTTGSPTGLLNTPLLSIWNITNAVQFAGHEKNVYCLLKINSMPAATDENRIIDTFYLVLNDLSGNHISTSKYIGRIGASHDPNMIEVDKPVSNICGSEEEELEYIIHFQNIGSGSANKVKVNLELDPVLDPATLKVWEVGIGTQSILGAASATIPLIQSASQFPNNGTGSFDYLMNATRTTSSTAVGDDVTFNFSSIDLKGLDATNIEDSKGYIRFTVKTRQVYSSIHNRAGIFFDRNSEIVTNLAETKCLKDSITMNCDSCRMHLKECRDQLSGSKADSSNGRMFWLGWIIAGIELLIIVYFLTRKKN